MQTLHICTYGFPHISALTKLSWKQLLHLSTLFRRQSLPENSALDGKNRILFSHLTHILKKNSDSSAEKKTGYRPATTKTQSSPPSVLIILMGALGDVARGLCLVSHIKNHWPHCRITWLIETQWVDVVRYHPGIDRVIVFDRPRGVRAVWSLRKKLAVEHFDITLDLQRHLKSGFFSFLSGARRRVGFHPKNAKEFNWLFNTEYIEYSEGGTPKIDLYLRFAKQLELPPPQRLDFGFSTLNLHTLRPNLSARLTTPYLAVVMGSSWKSKNWVIDGYAQLVSYILTDGKMGVVLLGNRSQATQAERLTKMIGNAAIVNLVNKTSIIELVAVLKSAAVAVGPDSGPGHLSGSVATPYVSLFGPTDPSITAPYGSENLVVRVDTDCGPCYKKECPTPERWCMRKIDVDMVKKKIYQAFNSLSHGLR
jgi:ADP-heptose:LPS heptosyltransferase